MDFTGILKMKGATTQVKDTFKKRELVITDEQSQYPQQILFELTQDKCSILDQYDEGDELKVYFNLRGREWKDREGKVRYFNSLHAWKIELVKKGDGSKVQNNNSFENDVAPGETFTESGKNINDDLPF